MYGILSLGLGLGLMTLCIMPIFSYINNGKTVTVIVFHCFISLKPLQVKGSLKLMEYIIWRLLPWLLRWIWSE